MIAEGLANKKAMDDAKLAGQNPTSVPQTKAVKRAKTKREEAKKKLDEAIREEEALANETPEERIARQKRERTGEDRGLGEGLPGELGNQSGGIVPDTEEVQEAERRTKRAQEAVDKAKQDKAKAAANLARSGDQGSRGRHIFILALLSIPLWVMLLTGEITLPGQKTSGLGTQPTTTVGPVGPLPTSPAPRWVIPPKPAPPPAKPVSDPGPAAPAQININNINGHGNPAAPVPAAETVVIDNSPPVATPKPQETVEIVPPVEWEPLNIHLTGPSDPDRLLTMLVALSLVTLPLVIDTMRGRPRRTFSPPNYLPDSWHTIIMALWIIFLIWKADQDFGWQIQYSASARTVGRGFQRHLSPAIVAAVEGSEQMIWGAEDLVFGNGRALIGMLLSVVGVVMLTQRKPARRTEGMPYAPMEVQGLYTLVAGIIGLFIVNA